MVRGVEHAPDEVRDAEDHGAEDEAPRARPGRGDQLDDDPGD